MLCQELEIYSNNFQDMEQVQDSAIYVTSLCRIGQIINMFIARYWNICVVCVCFWMNYILQYMSMDVTWKAEKCKPHTKFKEKQNLTSVWKRLLWFYYALSELCRYLYMFAVWGFKYVTTSIQFYLQHTIHFTTNKSSVHFVSLLSKRYNSEVGDISNHRWKRLVITLKFYWNSITTSVV